MLTAQVGDRVQVQFCRVPEPVTAPGAVKHQKSVAFMVGGREVFPSLSFGIVGMAPGDRKRFTLQPDEAYGNVEPKLIRQIPRTKFPGHLSLHVGKRLTANRGTARRRRVTIVELNSSSVTVDGNHPLAGKVVVMDVYLVSLDSSSNANDSEPQFDMGGES